LRKKPVGVTIVGVLVLLGSFVLGLLSYLGFIWSVMGGYPSFGIEPNAWSLFIFSIFFALAGLSLSIVVFQNVSSKYLWRALMAYWISLIVIAFIQDSTNSLVINYIRVAPIFPIWYLPTYVIPIGCIAYFLTKKPRQYYHLIAEQPVVQASNLN
jgi:uncharacterized membrane protein